jgi:hypothetical protein
MFGVLVTVLALGTVSAGSQAANRGHTVDGPGAVIAPRTTILELLPLQASRDALFGSFVRPSSVPDALPSDEACPPGMVEVEGEYCPLVEQRCLRWLDSETKLQCAEFARAAESGRCAVKLQHQHFCIDRYEWPNRVGALPDYMASFRDAKAACQSVGKRLCNDTEWTLACEGPERRPYPYGNGFERDDRACNIDKPYIWPRPERLFDPKTQGDELARLDQREPSGTRASCVSPYGVRDMVGNVDEWVVNVSQAAHPYVSGLKGGYWGPVRTRCRPMTTAHDESFRYYQIGFRCCGEAAIVPQGDAPLASNSEATRFRPRR